MLEKLRLVPLMSESEWAASCISGSFPRFMGKARMGGTRTLILPREGLCRNVILKRSRRISHFVKRLTKSRFFGSPQTLTDCDTVSRGDKKL